MENKILTPEEMYCTVVDRYPKHPLEFWINKSIREYHAQFEKWLSIEKYDQLHYPYVAVGWHKHNYWNWKKASFYNGRWWDLSLDIELFPTHFFTLPSPPPNEK